MRPDYDSRKLNALTRYPVVPTYHVPGAQNCPTGRVKVSFAQEPDLIFSEKIAGHSIRIILTSQGYFVGNKTEILAWNEDIATLPTNPILEGMQENANNFHQMYAPKGEGVKVLFGVFFGGSSHPHSRQYTGGDSQLNSFRLSDAFNLSPEEFSNLLSQSPEQIGEWRENNQQPFFSEAALLGLGIPVNPRLLGNHPPINPTATHTWMKQILPKSKASLNYQAAGKPNGILIRTPNRSKIAKLSFAEYEKLLK
jgi:hypothetical protein